MMKRIGMACTALTVWGGAAQAQWIVSDPAVETTTAAQFLQSVAQDALKVAHQVEIINNQIEQIVHLRNTLAAVSHGNLAALGDVMPELGSLGLTSPLGSDMGGAIQAMSGLGADLGRTQALTENVLQSDQYFASTVGDFRALSMNSTASGLAAQKAMIQTLLTASGQRLTSLTALRNNLSSTPDVKAATDAGARLVGEQATAQEHTNQLLAMQGLARVQAATAQAQEQQIWRCASEQLVAQSRAAATSAGVGTVSLVSGDTGSVACTAQGLAQSTATASNAAGSLTSAPISTLNTTTLLTMTNQSWGQQAANNAAAIGVNPTALAATCVIESGCRANPGGSGTISGAFQMSDGTYAQTVSEIQASNPNAAAQITTKDDPASQAYAAAQYLKDGATALQRADVANPTVLDVRGYYNFGPGYAAQVATASDNQLMSTVLSGMSSSSLTANGISSNTTVGQWRQGVVSKIGDAATQPVLMGTSS
jgi:hypothetical protein